jgi:hypothetical protein
VDLEYGLVFSRQLELGRAAMVLCPGQELEAHLLVELDVRLHIANDDFDVIDSDNHGQLLVSQALGSVAATREAPTPSILASMV